MKDTKLKKENFQGVFKNEKKWRKKVVSNWVW